MLLRARWVLPVASDAVDDGAVVVRGGRIHDVGPFSVVASRHPGERLRDLGEAILFPGFVNAHAHLELTLLRGLLDDLAFFPWIRRVVELKADGLKADEYVFYSLLGAAEMIRAGTTCVADCSDTGAPFDALALSGLRGTMFQEAFAPTPEMVPHAIESLGHRLDALQAMDSGRVQVGISPHSTFMSCEEMLRACAELATDRLLPRSIHAAESAAELAFLADGTGPIADHFRGRGWPVQASGRGGIEQVTAAGWLGLDVPVQLVHAVAATAREIDALALASRTSSARIGLAACPRSNAQLGNGLPDLRAWTSAGLCWGLGTDGAPSAGTCDMFSEMRFAYLAERATARDPSASQARSILSRATLESARALGLEASIGSLEVGKHADLAAVKMTAARCLPVHEPHAALVQCASACDVILTMVAGEVLFDGKDVLTIDEERVAARCRERAAVLDAGLSGGGRPRASHRLRCPKATP